MANPLTRVIMNNIAGKSMNTGNGTSNKKIITNLTNLKDKDEQLLKSLIYRENKIEISRASYSSNRPQQIQLTSLNELAAKSSKNISDAEADEENGRVNPPVKNDVMVKKHVIAGNHVDLLSLGTMAKKGSIK